MLRDFLSKFFYEASLFKCIVSGVFFLKQILIIFSYLGGASEANNVIFIFVNSFLGVYSCLTTELLTEGAIWWMLTLSKTSYKCLKET